MTESINPSAKISRPPVSEYTRYTIVPKFHGRPEDGPEGTPGRYSVWFILGVPGIGSIFVALSEEQLLASGESLIFDKERTIRESDPEMTITSKQNESGAIGSIRVDLYASSFREAESISHDRVMPLLSTMSFLADAPVESRATIMYEMSTGIRVISAQVIGMAKRVRPLDGLTENDLDYLISNKPTSRELRALLATYREGLNSTTPLYQALSFYKVIEGFKAAYNRQNHSKKGKSQASIRRDPMTYRIPSRLDDIPGGTTPGTDDKIRPFLSNTFEIVYDAMETDVRNAIAHLTNMKSVHTPDLFISTEKCRDSVPILRYIARTLLEDRLATIRHDDQSK